MYNLQQIKFITHNILFKSVCYGIMINSIRVFLFLFCRNEKKKEKNLHKEFLPAHLNKRYIGIDVLTIQLAVPSFQYFQTSLIIVILYLIFTAILWRNKKIKTHQQSL